MDNFNAAEYDQTAGKAFAPIYPVIARQIVTKTGKIKGKCLDIGAGPGYLGLALAEITDMEVYLFDISQNALQLAAQKIAEAGLKTRVQTLWGDVHQIPLADESFDLVISRGSFLFWKNKPKAFREIYRILAPGGFAYVGGGFGSEELRVQVMSEMKKDVEWERQKKRLTGENTAEKLIDALMEADISTYELSMEGGLWVIIQKYWITAI